MSRIVKVLKPTTINEVSYEIGDTIDLDATGQVENYYSDYAFIIPRAKKEITLEIPDNFPILSKYIAPNNNMLEFDFTLLDVVTSESPSYVRGKKTRSEYYVEGKLAASKDFTDVYTEEGILKELWIKFTWYNSLGEVSLFKDQMVKKFNKFEAETTMRERRDRQLDFLVGAAKGTAQEAYITFLFTHYRQYITIYISEDDKSWSTEIDKDLAIDLATLTPEQQQYFGTIQAILNADTPRVDDPARTMKVWQALKYQIGTFDLDILDAELDE